MAQIRLQPRAAGAEISPFIYGHFAEHLGACIYDGIWVGEESSIPNTGGLRDDVVAALRRSRPAVLRWPGGCFADDYHWADGIGPRAERPRRVNIHWGEVVETNAFGTHEFVRLCRAIGAEPYLCGNVGTGHPRELRDWVEYCNRPSGTTLSDARAADGSAEPLRVRFWGVGNENWGCGGNFTPEDYCTEYRRFATFVRPFGGVQPFRIACGPCGNDAEWTRRFFEKLFGDYWRGPGIEGFAAHYYCGSAGGDVEFTTDQWYEQLEKAAYMETMVAEQRTVMDEFDPERKIALIVDEWGAWHHVPPEKGRPLLWQQNTVRDALVAAVTLDVFNRHADAVFMSNIAQTVNVLQALVLTDGPRMAVTPTCHVYTMYADHQSGASVPMKVDAGQINFEAAGEPRTLFGLAGSASLKGELLTVTLTNTHASEPLEVEIVLEGGARVRELRGEVLTHEDVHAHNTFESPDEVQPRAMRMSKAAGRTPTVTLAPASVTKLSLRL